MREITLVRHAFKRLQNTWRVTSGREVPLLGRSVDLAYIFRGKIFAIEFKLKNWRRAIDQSRDHLLGADFAYICMPERKVTDEMRQELESYGIGLVFFKKDGRWPFKEVISARPSDEIWSVARMRTFEYVTNNCER